MKIKVGADPEVFLRDRFGFVSAFGMFPGTKKEPFPLENGAVQVDGMALEYNINPAETEDEFEYNMSSVQSQIAEMVKKVGGTDLKIVIEPVADFDSDYFSVQPYEPKILGCDPDYDMDGNMKVPEGDLEMIPFRTAAGHVHIGITQDQNPLDIKHFETCKKISGLFVGQKYFTARTKNEKRRTKYYGQDGSFRPKSYGAELRSPSNLWTKEEKTRREMFRLVQDRMKRLS